MKRRLLGIFLSLALLVGLLPALPTLATSSNPAIKLDFTGFTAIGENSSGVVNDDLSIDATTSDAGLGGVQKAFPLDKINLDKTPYLYLDIAGTTEEGVTMMVAVQNSLIGTGGDWGMEENVCTWTALTSDGIKCKLNLKDSTKLKLDNGGNLVVMLRFSGKATTVKFNGVYFADENFVYEGATYDGTTLNDGKPLSNNPAVKLDFTGAEARAGATFTVKDDLSVVINGKEADADYHGIVKNFKMSGIDLAKTPILRYEIQPASVAGVTLMLDVSNSLNGTDGDWSMICEALRWKPVPENGVITLDLRDYPQLNLNNGGDLQVCLMFHNETDDFTDDGLREDIVFRAVYLSDEEFVYEGAVYGTVETTTPSSTTTTAENTTTTAENATTTGAATTTTQVDGNNNGDNSGNEDGGNVDTGVPVTPVLLMALVSMLMVIVLVLAFQRRKVTEN